MNRIEASVNSFTFYQNIRTPQHVLLIKQLPGNHIIIVLDNLIILYECRESLSRRRVQSVTS